MATCLQRLSEIVAHLHSVSVSVFFFFQAARWVAVKEASAGNIMTVVAEYMLAQRVKKELFETNGNFLLSASLSPVLAARR